MDRRNRFGETEHGIVEGAWPDETAIVMHSKKLTVRSFSLCFLRLLGEAKNI